MMSGNWIFIIGTALSIYLWVLFAPDIMGYGTGDTWPLPALAFAVWYLRHQKIL